MLVVSPVIRFAGVSRDSFAGMPAKESLWLGVRMNCCGVTELLQYRLINALGFMILVLTALATTTVTGPLVQLPAG